MNRTQLIASFKLIMQRLQVVLFALSWAIRWMSMINGFEAHVWGRDVNGSVLVTLLWTGLQARKQRKRSCQGHK